MEDNTWRMFLSGALFTPAVAIAVYGLWNHDKVGVLSIALVMCILVNESYRRVG